MLAPLALVVFAVACFLVISSQGDDGVRASSEAGKAAATSAPAVKKTTRSVYRVKAGDSFGVIAEKTGITVTTLQQLNPDVDPRALQPGQKLKLR